MRKRGDTTNDPDELVCAEKVDYMHHVRHDYVDEEEYLVIHKDVKKECYDQEQDEIKNQR